MPITFAESQQEVAALVKHFRTYLSHFRSPGYKEAAARQDFIDPLFIALGWDVNNRQHLSPIYKEVIFEESREVEGATKAPDYTFRVGREAIFFVEAKRPGVNLKLSAEAAYQVRRYAWSQKLPLSILTDFEEFAVYEGRTRPHAADKASVARVNFYRYEDYTDCWREIWDIFSHEAVLAGSFQRYVESGKGRRGASEVDAEFLKDIERWREVLARHIALRNLRLSLDDLNDMVQRLIDRVVFLRIAEDRGIEPEVTLKRLTDGDNIYAGLVQQFYAADRKYNSGLFDFAKSGDSLSPRLKVDDPPLRQIILDLYYPRSPYQFDRIPVEILGNVYEQFLGKVIKLTDAHHAQVEQKPEVKKAGGVYYTPAYIVEYIVEQTIGKALEGKSPKQLEKFRVLDMACGSGSFLLGAYQYLLDYYLKWYMEHTPRQLPLSKTGGVGGRPLHLTAQGEWSLTSAERKRILTAHIFGVDIDQRAVEVTKLSLLLKVLEGETAELRQYGLGGEFQERALPNLDTNIKCGNSVISPAYFEGQLLPDDAELRRVNPFDWAREFPEVIKAGGFDVIIGNPPYGADLAEEARKYLHSKFDVSTTDTAALMMLTAVNLLRQNGWNGFIVPKPFTFSSNWIKVRDFLLNDIQQIVDVGQVWKEVKHEQIIYTSHKGYPTETYTSFRRSATDFVFLADIPKLECRRFGLYINGITTSELMIASKMMSGAKSLGDYVSNTRGGMLHKSIVQDNRGWRVIGGKQIRRYAIVGQKGYISANTSLPPKAWVKSDSILIQNIVAHIEKPVDHIKIIGTIAGVECGDFVILDTVNQLTNHSNLSSNYLLGLLLSRLINWYVYQFIFAKAIRTMHFDNPVSNRIPIYPVDFSNSQEKNLYDEIVASVAQRLEFQRKQAAAESMNDKALLQRQIAASDAEINAATFRLYGLTAEETAIIESQTVESHPSPPNVG